MPVNYDLEIEKSTKNGILNYADIFDFRGMPNEEYFEGFYKFCRESLDIHSKKENINPNIFLFANSLVINAKAGFVNGHSVMLINLGLLGSCFQNYLNNDKLKQFIEANFPDLIKKIDISINELAFQVTTQFTYYHELAHLFQLTKKKQKIELQERKTEDGYDLTRHKLEINADTYSSISVASHLEQYIDKIFGDEADVESVTNTIKILGAILLNYIINFSDNTNIYLKEHSHPHPFLRMVNIVLSISNHIQKMPSFKKKGMELDVMGIFRSINNFYQELEDNGVFPTKFSDLVYQNKDLQNDIQEYLKEILEFDNSEYEDAMDVWNRYII